MLKIPTYNGPTGSHVTVEPTDEAEVYLSIEIDPAEILGRTSPPSPKTMAEIEDGLAVFSEDYHPDHSIPLSGAQWETHALALAGEVRRLRIELGSIRPEVTRALTNDEAREVAAALWHRADENERRR